MSNLAARPGSTIARAFAQGMELRLGGSVSIHAARRVIEARMMAPRYGLTR